ncbi:hypothetical protein FSP39_000573 [Pinctada imbricata]|uniref:Thromboxane A2 receptor n=1 Tax=Pinctada imbricata TaxID=66713 RepID=A0AA88XXR5_PINIB|nr:hypothetical protein FSP39_000573 [Pinctada imbricata]
MGSYYGNISEPEMASHLYKMDLNQTFGQRFENFTDSNSSSDITNASIVISESSVINSGIMFGLGVFGNVLALIVLATSPKQQRRTIFYRLVAGLTTTDLVGIILLTPVVFIVYTQKKWVGGSYMCDYFGYCMMFFGFATMLIVCTMSIERVLCIKHPFIYTTRLSVKHATIFLLICWLLAAFISALPLLGFGNIVRKWPNTWCFINYYTEVPVHKAFNYLYGILALTFISVTVCCNFTVIYTILRSRKQQTLLKGRNGNTRKYNGKAKQYAECQMLILLVGITIVFSTCYAPLMVRIIMNQTDLVEKNLRTDLLLIRFASYNQIIDPWVYILLRREVVWKVISGVKFLCGIRQSSEEGLKIQQKLNTDTEDDNCCVFCLGCLCDPPVQRNRAGSVFSESAYDRRCTLMTGSSPLPVLKSGSTNTLNRLCASPVINRSYSFGTRINDKLCDTKINSNSELHLLLKNSTNQVTRSNTLSIQATGL